MTNNSRLLIRRVAIGGCGRTGAILAAAFCESGNTVQVLDLVPAAFDRLLQNLVRSGRIYPRIADVTLTSNLRAARIQDSDVFISVTGNDYVNAMAAQIAHHILMVPTVVCRVDDPVKRDMYEALEINPFSHSSLVKDTVVETVLSGRLNR